MQLLTERVCTKDNVLRHQMVGNARALCIEKVDQKEPFKQVRLRDGDDHMLSANEFKKGLDKCKSETKFYQTTPKLFS